jgi:hypothetical protein
MNWTINRFETLLKLLLAGLTTELRRWLFLIRFLLISFARPAQPARLEPPFFSTLKAS